MRVLIYGFKPYGPHKLNVSERVVRLIRDRKGLDKVIFPVDFKIEVFRKAVRRFDPQYVIGLGQNERGTKIRIERRAKNAHRPTPEHPLRKILPKGPRTYNATLPIQMGNDAWMSYDAGEYVCNYSMYVMLHEFKNTDTQFAFFHIPKSASAARVARQIDRVIKKLTG